jgi:hypothetical protein
MATETLWRRELLPLTYYIAFTVLNTPDVPDIARESEKQEEVILYRVSRWIQPSHDANTTSLMDDVSTALEEFSLDRREHEVGRGDFMAIEAKF